ncbi:MAG: twin-arginine translocase subunit TatB [Rhodospirillaceae bacterium]|nr:MAG: twin-arginine translocase subunit TatB [Rhodospirillaceae bacterium]
MFDIGWPELALVVLLAILVIGPKELPLVLRTLGRWAGKARALVRDFRSSLNEIAKEAELDEFRRMASGDMSEKAIEPGSTDEKARPASDSSVNRPSGGTRGE